MWITVTQNVRIYTVVPFGGEYIEYVRMWHSTTSLKTVKCWKGKCCLTTSLGSFWIDVFSEYYSRKNNNTQRIYMALCCSLDLSKSAQFHFISLQFGTCKYSFGFDIPCLSRKMNRAKEFHVKKNFFSTYAIDKHCNARFIVIWIYLSISSWIVLI